MGYLKAYVFFSLIIGVLRTTHFLYCYFKEEYHKIDTGASTKVLEDFVGSGDVQKEVYGERVVYYPKNISGKAAVDANEWMKKIKEDHLFFYVGLLIFAGLISETLLWPKYLWKFIHDSFRIRISWTKGS